MAQQLQDRYVGNTNTSSDDTKIYFLKDSSHVDRHMSGQTPWGPGKWNKNTFFSNNIIQRWFWNPGMGQIRWFSGPDLAPGPPVDSHWSKHFFFYASILCYTCYANYYKAWLYMLDLGRSEWKMEEIHISFLLAGSSTVLDFRLHHLRLFSLTCLLKSCL